MCTSIISSDDNTNPNLYFTNKDIRELTYSGLDLMYLLTLFSDIKKKKANEKFASPSHMSKFYDAITYGSSVVNKLFLVDFYSTVDTFLSRFKKEFAEAKKSTDEKEADAINSTLFKLLLCFSVDEDNIFVWCFALMWHLLARSVNIDSLSPPTSSMISQIPLSPNRMKQRWIRQANLYKKKMLF